MDFQSLSAVVKIQYMINFGHFNIGLNEKGVRYWAGGELRELKERHLCHCMFLRAQQRY